jgi:hypothetical protein
VLRVAAALGSLAGMADALITFLLRHIPVPAAGVWAALVLSGVLTGLAVVIGLFVVAFVFAVWITTGADADANKVKLVRGPGGRARWVRAVGGGTGGPGSAPRGGFGTVHGWAAVSVLCCLAALLVGPLLGGPVLPLALALVLAGGLAVGHRSLSILFRPGLAPAGGSGAPLEPGIFVRIHVTGIVYGPESTVPVEGLAIRVWRPRRHQVADGRKPDLERVTDAPAELVPYELESDGTEGRTMARRAVLSRGRSGSALELEHSTAAVEHGVMAWYGGDRPAIRVRGPAGPVIVAFDSPAERAAAVATLNALAPGRS